MPVRKRPLSAILITVLFVSETTVLANDGEDEFGIQAQKLVEFSHVAENAAENSAAPLSFVPCVRGSAAGFACHKIDLLGYVPSAALGGSFINDIWGWTDPETGKDYALVGMAEGVSVVDISDPRRPIVMGILPTHSTLGGDLWRDVKVYANHAFVVSENEAHGMQVLDLMQLRGIDAATAPVIFSEAAHYDGFSDAHNLSINEQTGFAYIVGSDQCAGGPHMVDISDPTNPTFAGCFADHRYSHDTQCVTYHGPDSAYDGREICFGSNSFRDPSNPRVNTLSIADVTDKNAPLGISNTTYAEAGYSHQGWLTPDHAYFLHGDEFDEFLFGVGSRTRIWDVRDLDNPSVIGVFDNTPASIDHNIYTEGRYAYASNYTSGLRVYDLAEVADGVLSEVAYFDMYPENDNTSFEGGSWSNFAYFRQKGVVAVSSIDRGLFILQTRVGRAGN